MRQKFWELGGSRMGKAVGVKEEKVEDDTNGMDEAQAIEGADGVRKLEMVTHGLCST